ncbi:phosphopantetheine-binding protein [Actinophytocola sp.]|uniref:phosphopantetheine-binding protein n=1 Tax=Actinophytocola sp. TaxID=1872138 RepID=UPI003D6AAD96
MDGGRSVADVVNGAWCAALGLERAEPTDNFFTAGGHSYSSVQLVTAVEAELHIEFPLETLFSDSLAELIEECANRLAATAGHRD